MTRTLQQGLKGRALHLMAPWPGTLFWTSCWKSGKRKRSLREGLQDRETATHRARLLPR